MIISTWVIGSTGLLGSAVSERLAKDPRTRLVSQAIRWADPVTSRDDLESGLQRWLDLPDATSFRLVWAAGAGVTSTTKKSLEAEVSTFQGFCSQLKRNLAARSLSRTVSMFLASSAGGIYSGGDRPPFTEASPARPVSPYGETKLEMERVVSDVARDCGIHAIVGRISNLYGPGQRIEKQQGFVSQLCKSMLTRRPIPVYVSLDTTRDYIYSSDAAVLIEACLERVEDEQYAGSTVVKNVASHVPMTLGRVLHDARLVFKRKPDVILASSPMAAGQARDLRVNSTVWPDLNDLPRRSLLVGLAETRASMELQLHAHGGPPR